MTESATATQSVRANGRSLSLSNIREPIASDLKAFRKYFRDAMQSDVRLLDLVTRYMLRRKGKQVRPILVLLSASACGGVNKNSYVAAALIELLHTATLVHDDVVDQADTRRGAFTINTVWKNRVAVLFGDFLLSRGLLLALDREAYRLLHVVSDAVRRMSEGELLQMDKARRLDITEDTYLRIISDKTASLFSACTTAGAISATDDPEFIQNMKTAGEKLGLAFQIRDDLFDYGGVDSGKPVGNDIRERKLTLPLIYSLSEASNSSRERIMKIVRRHEKTSRDVREITDFVSDHGGLEYARQRMETYSAETAALIGQFPESDARQSLLDLTRFVVTRRK